MRLTLRSLLSAVMFAALPGKAVAAGMPQLNFKDPYVQGQVVWGAIIFFGFYLILSRSALPRIANVLQLRKDRIEGDLNLARSARKNAENVQQERSAARHNAAEQARATILKIRDTAKAEAQTQARETAKRLEDEIRQAEANIASARENILSHLDEIAVETAGSLTERLIGQRDSSAITATVASLAGKIRH